MPRFLTLYNFTGAIKGGGPERFMKFKAIVEEEGGRILHFGGLLGAHDVFTLTEYPSNQAAMKGSARIGNLISARTQTFPVVDEPEFLNLLTQV
ncbi:MAG TPA: GYD domain-containing protein [bacterium]|nr:GYD domain-containing protein [bacterium]